MSMEQLAILEQRESTGIELPKSHLENIESRNLEGADLSSTLKTIGECCFDRVVMPFPGLRYGFSEISGSNSRKYFADCYCRYITSPKELREEKPEIYAFMRDRLFYGKEYLDVRSPLPELYSANEITLERNIIVDDSITNCQRPFSYGDAESMSRKMDYFQGDINMGAEGTCGLVSSRNLMALCGKEFTEKETAIFSWKNGFAEWYELLPPEKRGAIYDERVCSMIKGMSGIDTERVVYSETPFTADDIAEKLDRGYRGMFIHNFGVLHENYRIGKTLIGKIAEKIPVESVSRWIGEHCQTEYGDHVATFECAVRDGNTGKVAGFYICDSALHERKMYVEADQLMKALDVKDGAVVFTTKPYPDKS